MLTQFMDFAEELERVVLLSSALAQSLAPTSVYIDGDVCVGDVAVAPKERAEEN